VLLYEAHISPYDQAYEQHEPMRPRRLLLHRREINRLVGLVQQKGMTLVPLRMYFKGRLAKVELGVARGKKTYDKRQDLARRDAQREIDRAMKERNR
jgi:SsrA-binding protein